MLFNFVLSVPDHLLWLLVNLRFEWFYRLRTCHSLFYLVRGLVLEQLIFLVGVFLSGGAARLLRRVFFFLLLVLQKSFWLFIHHRSHIHNRLFFLEYSFFAFILLKLSGFFIPLLILQKLLQISLLFGCLLLGKDLRSESTPFKFFLLLLLLHNSDLVLLSLSWFLDSPLDQVNINFWCIDFMKVLVRDEKVVSMLLVEFLHKLLISLIKISFSFWILISWYGFFWNDVLLMNILFHWFVIVSIVVNFFNHFYFLSFLASFDRRRLFQLGLWLFLSSSNFWVLIDIFIFIHICWLFLFSIGDITNYILIYVPKIFIRYITIVFYMSELFLKVRLILNSSRSHVENIYSNLNYYQI